MLKSFKTLNKLNLKSEQHCKQDEQLKIIDDSYEVEEWN